MHFAYPPPTLPLLYAFAAMPLPTAQIAWCTFQFGLLIGGLLLLLRALGVRFGSPASVLIGGALLLSNGASELFRWGQFDGVVFILLAAAFLLLARRRSLLGGVFVALAAVAKIFPVAYLAVFAVRRRFAALAAAGATIAVLVGIGLAALPAESRANWYYLSTFKAGRVDSIITRANLSLHGFVYRAVVSQDGDEPSTPWIDLGPTAAWWIAHAALGLVGLIFAAWIIRNRRILTTAECLAASVPVLLMATPVSWSHYCIHLLITIALIIVAMSRQTRARALDLCWVAGILLCYTVDPVLRFDLQLPSQLSHLLTPTGMYAVGLIWLFMLVRYVPLKRAILESDAPQATTSEPAPRVTRRESEAVAAAATIRGAGPRC